MGGTGDGVAGTFRASQRRIVFLSDGAATAVAAAAAAGAPTCETTCSRHGGRSGGGSGGSGGGGGGGGGGGDGSGGGGGDGGDGGGGLYPIVPHTRPSRMRASFSKSTDRSRPSSRRESSRTRSIRATRLVGKPWGHSLQLIYLEGGNRRIPREYNPRRVVVVVLVLLPPPQPLRPASRYRVP